MSAITAGPDIAVSDLITADAATELADAPKRRGIVFWVVRYLPAEIVGTAAMVMAGLAVTIWTDAPALIAIAALIGESIGFYAVLAITIYAEQSAVAPTWRRAVVRTFMLLLAEFGPAELLDTLLIRPAALTLGVFLLPDPLWGLLAGKVFADIIFYAIAAGAFTDHRQDRPARRPPFSGAGVMTATATVGIATVAIATTTGTATRRQARAARTIRDIRRDETSGAAVIRHRARGDRPARHARAAAGPRARAPPVPAPRRGAAVRRTSTTRSRPSRTPT